MPASPVIAWNAYWLAIFGNDSFSALWNVVATDDSCPPIVTASSSVTTIRLSLAECLSDELQVDLRIGLVRMRSHTSRSESSKTQNLLNSFVLSSINFNLLERSGL